MFYYDPFAWIFSVMIFFIFVIIMAAALFGMDGSNSGPVYRQDNTAQYMAQVEKERTKQIRAQERTDSMQMLMWGGIVILGLGGAGVLAWKALSREPQQVTYNYTINNAPQIPMTSVPHNRILEAKNNPDFYVVDMPDGETYDVTYLPTNERKLLTTK